MIFRIIYNYRFIILLTIIAGNSDQMELKSWRSYWNYIKYRFNRECLKRVNYSLSVNMFYIHILVLQLFLSIVLHNQTASIARWETVVLHWEDNVGRQNCRNRSGMVEMGWTTRLAVDQAVVRGWGGRELTIGCVLVLIGRTVASVICARNVAIVVVHTVRGRCVFRGEVFVGVLNGVTVEIIQ